MSSSNARKRLPVRPSAEHLHKQAKRRAKRDAVPLAEAQHRLAGEYGSRTWAELMHVVETMNRGADQLVNVKREVEPLPAAVRARDVKQVREVLASGDFTQHDLDAGLAHAAWYGGDAPEVLRARRELFDLLLDHGADPDGQYGSAYGPIILGTGECLSPDGLQWLLDAGADATFPPVETKYGPTSPLITWLGTYDRGGNARKHRGIELLLARGAWVPPEVTPSLLAIHRGDAAGLAALLDREPDLVRRTFPDMPYGNIALRGATLLHMAVEFDELECIDVLLDRWADVNQRAEVIDGVGGQTPVFHLLNTGWAIHLPTLRHLVQRAGARLDLTIAATWRTWEGPRATPATAIAYAEEPGDPKWRKHRDEELELLRGLDRRGRLRAAAAAGDAALLGRLLDADPELLTPELWPPAVFKTADEDAALAVVRLLLDRGLDPDRCSAPRKPLHLAADRGRAAVVRLLLARGAAVAVTDGEGYTSYDLLCSELANPANAAEIRGLLRAAGATDTVFTRLMLAAREPDGGHEQAAIALLRADPTLRDTHGPVGFTPLQLAARAACPAAVRELLAQGAPVDDPRPGVCTALWLAAQSGADAARRLEVAEVLLAAGADPRRACDDDGSTALHPAAWRGPLAMVELLIRHGAKEWLEDRRGRRPLAWARDGQGPEREAIAETLDRPVLRDPRFRAAVAALHSGDLPKLRALLAAHPDLSRLRVVEPACYGQDYFRDPKLLWFTAGNPIPAAPLPGNLVELASAIIDAGVEQHDLDYTLALVMSGLAARRQGLQRPLIALLLARGAVIGDPHLVGVLGHGEREAAEAVIAAGLPLTAPVAAGLGRLADLARLLPAADDAARHAAFTLAVINRERECARLCLQAGADPNRRLVAHEHSWAVHQAAFNDDVALLALLVGHGARLDVRDTMWHGTPRGWAAHGGRAQALAWLEAAGAP